MKKEYKVICPVCWGMGTKKDCCACAGKGYNIIVFKDGKRIS